MGHGPGRNANNYNVGVVTMKKHTVVVSNIGTVVLDGTRAEAKAAFAEYQSQSRSNLGRAAGEDVTWFSDGEIYKEYVGDVDCVECVEVVK